MARTESDHEDLMKEAVSLVRRIECRCPARSDLVVAGFNNLGWLFVYLGSDPMYRFDECGRLRRAFVDGILYRTGGDTLAAMQRTRTSNSTDFAHTSESTLRRRDLSSDELEVFRQRLRRDLEELNNGLSTGEITRQHPVDAPAMALEIQSGLQVVLESREFLAPAIVRR